MDGRGLDERRLRLLLEIGTSIVAELDSEAVLQRVLEAGRELTGARYAAIGILDAERRGLERFLTAGVDKETRRAIGELPRGSGILGELIRNPKPLRLADISQHPRSYGFPPEHPPMTTFLGAPVLVRGEAWGNIYLTEKDGGEFDEADEQALWCCEVGGDRDRERPPLRGHRRPPRRARARRERARGHGRHCAGGGRRDGPRPGGGARRQARPCPRRRARVARAAGGRQPAGGGGSCRRGR